MEKTQEFTTVKKLLGFGAGDDFISPTIEVKTGKEVKPIIPSLALHFGYIAMFATNGNADSATDKTKGKAGELLADALDGIAKETPDSVVNVYMPKTITVRDSSKKEDLHLVVTVGIKAMAEAARTLANANNVMEQARKDVKAVTDKITLKETLSDMPVYTSKTASKRGGGTKVKPTATSIFG